MARVHPELERLRKEQEERIRQAKLKQLSQKHFDVMKVCLLYTSDAADE